MEASHQGAVYFNQLIVEDQVRSVEKYLRNVGQLMKPEALDAWQKGAKGVLQDFVSVVGGVDHIKAVQPARAQGRDVPDRDRARPITRSRSRFCPRRP